MFLSGYVEREIRLSLNSDTTLSYENVKDQFIETNLTGPLKELVLAEWAYNVLTKKKDIGTGQLLLSKFILEYPNSKYTLMLRNTLALTNRLQPGNPAPQFTFPDLNGNMISLSDFKGKIVYLDIWASWCGPCRSELPHAKILASEMKDKGVVFLNVSVDENEEVWKNFIKENDMEGIHLISKGNFESQITHLYNARGIPHYIIIGTAGEIVDIDAKRPSNGAQQELEKLLK
jgi:peroxiredoxin